MGNQNKENEQEDIKKILISIIMLYGDNGLPLEKVDTEFINYCGYTIPYKKFGEDTLRSWLLTLSDIYLVTENHREVLFQQSSKSLHIKQLISKQKSKTMSKWGTCKLYNSVRLNKSDSFPKEYFIHSSINNPWINEYDRFDLFTKLVRISIFTLFVKHKISPRLILIFKSSTYLTKRTDNFMQR